MKKKFIENSLNYIEAKNDLSDLQKKKLKYGLEGFYNLFTKRIFATYSDLFFIEIVWFWNTR